MGDIRIGDRLIGESHSPFIIAELSGNHQQDLSLALEMVNGIS